ncbi:Protein-tyrosine phosphatase [Ancylostoma caninum]|uniref:Protein-tyrosine phosphatase n=1 Tax=Ancylostoma caninum TaxID=29170 RepID=A0A368GET6_ANCCA|nr:Protein-tyrosine phosphatase [Ancylostoma caninum]
MARGKNKKNFSQLISSLYNDSKNATCLNETQRQIKETRMRLFAARTAIDVHPKLILCTKEKLTKELREPKSAGDRSPGVFSLHAAQILDTNDGHDNVVDRAPVQVSDARMRQLVAQCRSDPELVQNLLYEPQYDDKWKNCYTDVFLVDEGKKIVKPHNRQGWVVPLKNICEKAGIPSNFFTDNRSVTLQEARAHVLRSRLEMISEPSAWLTEHDPLVSKNVDLMSYLASELDPHALQTRLALYNEQTYADRDRIRVAGKCSHFVTTITYNWANACLDQVKTKICLQHHRRHGEKVTIFVMKLLIQFEILDNQVNHLPFTHAAFDENLDKCRNPRVKCRDSSRVVLRYPAGTEDTFIHANYVSGGPLFNRFIVTQAPMENTIGDFWRMVWQEKAPYIFMLIGRKEKDRCADYWPRRPESGALDVSGLHVHNVGISSSRDPMFRVTYIRIVDDFGEEHRVEHWQADMNNSSNLDSPLAILRLARNSVRPVIIHDCLGISRAACVVATEIAICNIIKGPTYKHPIQKAVHFLRRQRPFSVETPMQFIFIHRCVQKFFGKISGPVRDMAQDYKKWLTERAGRMFVDNLDAPVPGYRLLSPRVDPDLLRLVRRPQRPNVRREAPDCVGELPIPLNPNNVLSHARRELDV